MLQRIFYKVALELEMKDPPDAMKIVIGCE